jgi:hypothetical protein
MAMMTTTVSKWAPLGALCLLVAACTDAPPPRRNTDPDRADPSDGPGGRGGAGGIASARAGAGGTTARGGSGGSVGQSGAGGSAPAQTPPAAEGIVPRRSPDFDHWYAWEKTARSSKLPIVFVDANGQMSRVSRTKQTVRIRIVSEHDGTHKDLDKAKADVDSLALISVRGSSSAGFPQKGYTFGFLNDQGFDTERKVLDMPSGEDWALIACWTDKGCMRNALAYAMGRIMGRYNPRLRFVETYFDGKYNGIYQLVEPPRADKWRVDVKRPAWDKSEGDITGGYIVRREMGGKGSPTSMPILDFVSPVKGPDGFTQTVLTYHFPKELRLSKAHQEYITDYFGRFETMMMSPDWKDPQKGYPRWIDVPSWIDFGLLNEITNNVDAYWKSMYIVKDSDTRGGKLYQLPAWDFNIAFGNADYREGDKLDVWAWKLNRFGGENQGSFVPRRTDPAWNMPYVPFWYVKLWEDPGFQDQMKCRFRKHREKGGAFDLDSIDLQIENWRKELSGAVPRHFLRWQGLLTKVWPNVFVSDKVDDPPKFFDEEVDWFKKWVRDRMAFLDANLPGTCRN